MKRIIKEQLEERKRELLTKTLKDLYVGKRLAYSNDLFFLVTIEDIEVYGLDELHVIISGPVVRNIDKIPLSMSVQDLRRQLKKIVGVKTVRFIR